LPETQVHLIELERILGANPVLNEKMLPYRELFVFGSGGRIIRATPSFFALPVLVEPAF